MPLNSEHFELSGGANPSKLTPRRFLGRLAEGAPLVASELFPSTEHDRIHVGSIFIEAIPLGADAAVVQLAAELLPPMPLDDPDLVLPDYDQPLEGELAAWVIDARALVEMFDLAP